MENAVSTLATTVSSDALWGVFANCINYISVVVLVAFGMYLIRRMLRGISKAKAKIQQLLKADKLYLSAFFIKEVVMELLILINLLNFFYLTLLVLKSFDKGDKK